tara:strand:+ start:99 stop:206 length:108 start_codon:yes stop_codon:yes gene_type:complete
MGESYRNTLNPANDAPVTAAKAAGIESQNRNLLMA